MELPINFKDRILNGTMKAFVNNRIDVNVGDKFYFISYEDCYEGKITTLPDFLSDYVEDRSILIVKAECVSVVKYENTLLPIVKKKKDFFLLINSVFRNYDSYMLLGFKSSEEAIKHYDKNSLLLYESSLYLHSFKLLNNDIL